MSAFAYPASTQESNPSDTNDIPTRRELLILFKQKRNEGRTVSLHDLIQSLGGIDAVMDTVMNAPHHRMTHDNLQSMQELLTKSPRPALETMASDTDIVTKMMTYSADMECKQRLQWTLNPTNNFLQQISPFLAKYTFSKQMMAIHAFFSVACMASKAVVPMWVYNSCVMLITWFMFIPWSIAALMSINKDMILRIIKTPDTWIKIIMMIVAMGFSALYNVLTSESPAPLVIAFYASATICLCMVLLEESIYNPPIQRIRFIRGCG